MEIFLKLLFQLKAFITKYPGDEKKKILYQHSRSFI